MTTVSYRQGSLNALEAEGKVAPPLPMEVKDASGNPGMKSPGTPSSSPRRVIFPALYNGSALSPQKDAARSVQTKGEDSTEKARCLPPLKPQEEEKVRSRLDPILPLPALPKCTRIDITPNEQRFVLASGASPQTSRHRQRQAPLPESPLSKNQRNGPSNVEREKLQLELSLNQPGSILSPPSQQWKKVGRTQSLWLPQRAKPSSAAKPGPSILRSTSLSSRKAREEEDVCKVSSIESDMPSLASTMENDSQSSSDEQGVTCTPLRRHTSETPKPSISFDARIWICNFRRSQMEQETTWYSAKDLAGFKQNAIQQIMKYNETELVPTGTGRVVRRQRQVSCPPSRALFSHPALKMDHKDDDLAPAYKNVFRHAVLENEIRHVLLVDPHDMCLKLFAKALKSVMPHVHVTACRSSQEAIRHIQEGEQARKRFDLVIVEERLKIFYRQHRNGGATEKQGSGYHAMANDHHASGSMLLKMMAGPDYQMEKSLFVGVSAHIGQDGARLRESGADFCWAKPPPQMDDSLLNDLLRALLIKRGRANVAKELFAET